MGTKKPGVKKHDEPIEAPRADRDPFSYLENYLGTLTAQVGPTRAIASELIRDRLLDAKFLVVLSAIGSNLSAAKAWLDHGRARWRDDPREPTPLDPNVAMTPFPEAPGGDIPSSPFTNAIARAIGADHIKQPDRYRSVRIQIGRGGHMEVELSQSRADGTWRCTCGPYKRAGTCEHVEAALRVCAERGLVATAAGAIGDGGLRNDPSDRI